MKKKSEVDTMLSNVIKKYGINLDKPLDVSKPSVSKNVEREIAERCKPVFEAWDRAEAASRANASKLWTC